MQLFHIMYCYFCALMVALPAALVEVVTLAK